MNLKYEPALEPLQVRSRAKRKGVREALLLSRGSSPLFDVRLWTHSFEAGLAMALDALAGPNPYSRLIDFCESVFKAHRLLGIRVQGS